MTDLHLKKLVEIINYCSQLTTKPSSPFPKNINEHLEFIGKNIPHQKGMYTVIITSAIYKLLTPSQDIRNHQTAIPQGYSGRGFDTKYVTPTLKKYNLTSMAESGWLTRSLEQPYPYNMDYEGKIRVGRKQFLEIIEFINENPNSCEKLLQILLYYDFEHRKKNTFIITPLENPDKISINKFLAILKDYTCYNFNTSGGSKIPVIVMYSFLEILISIYKKYKDHKITDLGSHTASDRTSKTSGDIEVFKDDALVESYEIKLDILIDYQMILRIEEKIYNFNPKKYFIITTNPSLVVNKDNDNILNKIENIRNNHGCQIIIENLFVLLKNHLYYMNEVDTFVNSISKKILNDIELKRVHKTMWKKILDDQIFIV